MLKINLPTVLPLIIRVKDAIVKEGTGLVSNALQRSPSSVDDIDPTRTKTIRRRYESSLLAVMRRISQAVQSEVGARDVLGLSKDSPNASTWRFLPLPRKVEWFQGWIEQMIEREITGSVARQKWDKIIQHAFERGASRSFTDTMTSRRSDPAAAVIDPQSLRASFGLRRRSDPRRAKTLIGNLLTVNAGQMGETPQEVLDFLLARNFAELEGFTADMAAKLQRILLDGMTEGLGPLEIAKKISDQLGISAERAKMIAQTEVIRAYAEGQLEMLDKMGVTEVGVKVEWSTAGDLRVCPLCRDMNGKVFTIKKAKGKIPRHPRCRCAWIPWMDVEGMLRESPPVRNPKPAAPSPKKLSETEVVSVLKNLGSGHRINIADVVDQLAGYSKEEIDAILWRLSDKGLISLYRLDNPREITDRDRKNAVKTSTGEDKHILYFD